MKPTRCRFSFKRDRHRVGFGGLMKIKDQILAESLTLFSTKGYDKTSISDICKASESSRGGFYHHFQSKEDVLSTLTDNYMKDFSKIFTTVVRNHQGSEIDLFEKIYDTFIDFKIGQIAEWNELQKMFLFKGNHQIISKITRTFEKMISEVYEDVFSRGNRSKEFQCMYVKPLSKLWTRELMLLLNKVQKDRFSLETLSDETLEHIVFIEEIVAGGLKIEKSSINLKQKLTEYFNKMEDMQ